MPNRKRKKERKDRKGKRWQKPKKTGNPNYGDMAKVNAFLIKEGEHAVSMKILTLLSDQQTYPKGLSSRDIAAKLGYKEDDLPGFWNVLHRLLDMRRVDKDFHRNYAISGTGLFELSGADAPNRPSIFDKPQEEEEHTLNIDETYEAVIYLRREGFSRAKISGTKAEVFVERRFINRAFDRDAVQIVIISTPSKKEPFYQAKVVKIIERYFEELVGRVEIKKKEVCFLPDNPNFGYAFFVRAEDAKKVKHNDKIILSDMVFAGSGDIYGKVKKNLGMAGDPTTEMQSILLSSRIDLSFPKRVLTETDAISTKLPKEEFANRLDFREACVFTIDPEDAKDFDDAFSVEKTHTGYKIGVHIADVSYYVKENSLIDKEAQKRGTSVYLVDRVVPMLPSRLCEDVCSLNPNVDRLAYSVIFEIDANANILDYQIAKTVIHSKKRFTYEDAQKVLLAKSGEFSKELMALDTIAKKLLEKRIENGALNFETEEWKVKLDDAGKPISTYLKPRLDTHHLVEEFMLLANKTIATHIAKHYQQDGLNYPCIYRVHNVPVSDKIVSLANFTKTAGYGLTLSKKNGEVVADSKSIQSLLESIKGSPVETLVSDLALRSMSKAIYDTKNIGHFGLGFDYYLHFTSPIRRYPDLVTHRLLFEYESNRKKNKKLSAARVKKLWTSVPEICESSSLAERSAADAERRSILIKQVEYAKNFIGETLDGVVADAIEFGMYVKISKLGIEGFVHIRDFPKNDSYIFEKKLYALVGRRTRDMYSIGRLVRVTIRQVDEYKQRINLVLEEKGN